jgi:hypothetical protein
MAAIGLLAQDWASMRVTRLGEAVVEEATRRAFVRRLDGTSESERLQLAWAALGSGCGDNWLDASLDTHGQRSMCDGFNILTASHELEALENKSPDEYSPRCASLLPEMLVSRPPEGTLEVTEWSSLRALLSRWSCAVDRERETGGLWLLLDTLMTDDSAAHEETLHRLATVLRPGPPPISLRDALGASWMSTLPAFAWECLQGLRKTEQRQGADNASVVLPPRLAVAAALRAIVTRREAIARKYPIVNADFPCSHPISGKRMEEMWGSPAVPVDKWLYEEARRKMHSRHANRPAVFKAALSEKEYRNLGGVFAFPTKLDTFVPGLHRRTKDLHDAWVREKKTTTDPATRTAAVEEMLLRLRWDDRDKEAHAK